MAEPPLRVLVVDDEAPARRRLRDLLDDCGAALPLTVVGEAQHGREALDLLQTAPADLVLTDIHMPDMDGIESTREIMRQCPVPIVLASATLKKRDVNLALLAIEAGAISVIAKPEGAVLLPNRP